MRILRDISGKLPIVIIIVVVLVLALGAGAFAFLKMSHKSKAPEKKEPVKTAQWELGEFLVNLADPGDPRYLKVNLVAEIEDDGKKRGGEGAGDPEEAKAKDAVICALSKHRMNDLLTNQGKDALKSELKSALNEAIEGTKVVDVYFTSFAMQ